MQIIHRYLSGNPFIVFFLLGILFLSGIQCSKNVYPLSIDGTEVYYQERYKPFYHGVASGDPLEDRVIIWTRVTPDHHQPVQVN